jgi:hypothetical protein
MDRAARFQAIFEITEYPFPVGRPGGTGFNRSVNAPMAAVWHKTKAAGNKAKEHLDAAEVLADRNLFAQAYAHLVLALEESAVAGVRLLTESGGLSWTSPPVRFIWKECDLSRPRTHRRLVRLGVLIATIRPVLSAAEPGEAPNDPRVVLERLSQVATGPLMEGVPRLLTDPVLKEFLNNGDRRKMAAFYSSPWKPSPVPNEEDYGSLITFARPYILNIQLELPSPEDMATMAPLLQAVTSRIFEEFESKKTNLRDALDH